ncbi:hypothetical protein EU811_09710 [Arthrobacter sp. TS-15]|uniref:hypothetical protein n=1 Tax=Arthrobacter sp. TS-15 TaxID=2510797 RepID=UPI00115CAA4C|nr:hypothetical protein [Arthrobacter sp. TS-15]TQS92566.1 hypothetical protein EU811_09710 [Arthrobacter sp. TS-15]
MTTQRSGTASAVLRVALVTAVLALITGILGMHIVAGAHASHPAHAASVNPGADPSGTVAVSHGAATSTPVSYGANSHDHSDHGKPVAEKDPASGSPSTLPGEIPAASDMDLSQCLCSGNCAEGHSVSVHCIPNVAASSMAAPDPGRPVWLVRLTTATGNAALAPPTHSPRSPSPGELSISRT